MINCHAHTNYSYCADSNLTLDSYSTSIQRGELEAVCIVDHGMSIYFPKDIAHAWDYISDDSILDDHIHSGDALLEKYIAQILPYKTQNIYCGLEVEMSSKGRLIYNSSFRDSLYPLIGSVHFLPISKRAGALDSSIIKYWLDHTERLLNSNIDILGHPFRWISRQCSIDANVVKKVVTMAQEAGVILELNGHNMTKYNRELDLQMIEMVRNMGCKISFGVDSHSIKKISDFSYHYSILSELKYTINDFNVLKLEELEIG